MSKGNLIHHNNDNKSFINGFDFSAPNWEILPDNFPEINSKDLSEEEKGILSGIKLAWYDEFGRGVIYKQFAKTLFIIIFLIISGMYLRFITTTPTFNAVKEVSAATVSAGLKKLTVQRNDDFGEILESTMSARLYNE